MPETSSSDAPPATVNISCTEQGCRLELTGRMTRPLLDHARDLVLAQTKPATRLTIRFVDSVLTRDLVAMLVAIRRHLARSGSTLHIEDPDESLPLTADDEGRLSVARR